MYAALLHRLQYKRPHGVDRAAQIGGNDRIPSIAAHACQSCLRVMPALLPSPATILYSEIGSYTWTLLDVQSIGRPSRRT